jgi:hypothetical protein
MKRTDKLIELAAFLLPLSVTIWGLIALASAILRGYSL